MFFTFNLSLFLGSFCLKDDDIQRALHKILCYISIFLELNSFNVKKMQIFFKCKHFWNNY